MKINKDDEASVSNNKEKEQNDDNWDNMTTDPQTQVGIIRLHYNEWMRQSIALNLIKFNCSIELLDAMLFFIQI